MRGATKECQLRPRLFDFFVCLGKQKGMAIVRGVFVWGKTKELLDDEKWVGEMRRCLLRCFPDLKEGFEEEEEPSSPPSTASSSSPCSSPCDELPWVTNEHFFDTICGFHPMNECTWLAYVIDGVVVGVSAITYYHDSVYIFNLCVDKKYRRRGIGTALLEESGREGKKRGLMYVSGTVVEGNQQAMSLYFGLGAQIQYIAGKNTRIRVDVNKVMPDGFLLPRSFLAPFYSLSPFLSPVQLSLSLSALFAIWKGGK